jgi:hypothetical protein
VLGILYRNGCCLQSRYRATCIHCSLLKVIRPEEPTGIRPFLLFRRLRLWRLCLYHLSSSWLVSHGDYSPSAKGLHAIIWMLHSHRCFVSTNLHDDSTLLSEFPWTTYGNHDSNLESLCILYFKTLKPNPVTFLFLTSPGSGSLPEFIDCTILIMWKEKMQEGPDEEILTSEYVKAIKYFVTRHFYAIWGTISVTAIFYHLSWPFDEGKFLTPAGNPRLYPVTTPTGLSRLHRNKIYVCKNLF